MRPGLAAGRCGLGVRPGLRPGPGPAAAGANAAGAAAKDAAGAAAGDAAGEFLKPTVAWPQVSALDLIERMLAVQP